jgi:hypothetical protein
MKRTLLYLALSAATLAAFASDVPNPDGDSEWLVYTPVKYTPSQERDNEVAKWNGYATISSNLVYVEGIPPDVLSVQLCGYTVNNSEANPVYSLHASCNDRDFLRGNSLKITLTFNGNVETRLERVTPTKGALPTLRVSSKIVSGFVPSQITSRFPFVTSYHR